ncbi:MAG: CDP-diacylglycerol--serine O-phosphatidyltransferase [Hyphomicrobiales bacterium]|nr:CDP-diacylglycerol--serine O-phosphatidyltransferase [Hyphomicrobiales bacterium]
MASLFPPIDPENDGKSDGVPVSALDRRLRRRRLVPFRALLPNMVTLLAICAGLTAIRLAMEGNFELAVGALIFAAILDGVDGHVARLLKSTSRFGAQLDSLADFVNFGVAPGILLYVWRLADLKNIGWIVALALAICTALRLARFNAALDSAPGPDWHKDYFVGIPAPAGAMAVLLPLALSKIGVPVPPEAAVLVALYTAAIALLMVSRFPTWSGKRLDQRIPTESVMPFLVMAVLMIALLISYPFSVLTIGVVSYLAHLPFAWRAWRKRRAVETEREVGSDTGVGEQADE